MLNINSPIVQNMLQNLPTGGNGNFNPGSLQFYSGPTPTMTTETVPTQSPFPSPMQMAQQPQMYQETNMYQQPQMQYNQFGYQGTVPAYDMYQQQPQMYQQPQMQYTNPFDYQGAVPAYDMYQQQPQMYPQYQQPMMQQPRTSQFNQAFQGYSNQYFTPQQPNPTANMYGGYTGMYNNQYPYMYQDERTAGYNPNDSYSAMMMESAEANGISYKAQLENESHIRKLMSRLVSKNMGLSEEEAAAREAQHDIQTFEQLQKPYQQPQEPQTMLEDLYVPLKVMLVRGEEVLVDKTNMSDAEINMHSRNLQMLEQGLVRLENAVRDIEYRIKPYIQYKINEMYETSINRQADNMSLFDILNKHTANWTTRDLLERTKAYRTTMGGALFDKSKFDEIRRKFAKNGGGYFAAFGEAFDKSPMRQEDHMIRGGYGYLPGGIPTSPGNEEVGSCFSLDPVTGKMHVECPPAFRRSLEDRKNFANERMNILRDRFIRTIGQS